MMVFAALVAVVEVAAVAEASQREMVAHCRQECLVVME